MSNYEQFKSGLEGVEEGISLLGLGIGGIVKLVRHFDYEKCDIYINNNHYHNISVVLDLPKENKIRGWYNVEAGTRENIYTTERKTNYIGMHAECAVCGGMWGRQYTKYIPADGKAFKIESKDNDCLYGRQPVGFDSNWNSLEKEKEFTWNIQ